MIAVGVHQVIAIATELVAQLLDNPPDFIIRKVRAPDLYALPESKLFAELIVVSRLNLKDACERERVASVRVFCAKYFNARMKDAQSDRGCVIVDPVLEEFKRISRRVS